MARKAVTILLAVLLTISIITSLFLYLENINLTSQVLSLNEDVNNLKSTNLNLTSANLVTALGVVEIPPSENNYSNGTVGFSHLWITGWVFNSGAAMAKKAGLQVLAYDAANNVLMNYTVPVTDDSSGAFSTNETLKNLIPYYFYPAPLKFSNIFSQQNVTVRLAIFHNNVFSINTRYQINPVWSN